MTSAWWLGLAALALVLPQVVLAFRGPVPVWARLLGVAGVLGVWFAWWREVGTVHGLSNPYVLVGLAVGVALPFAIVWLARRVASHLGRS